jgi:integrase
MRPVEGHPGIYRRGSSYVVTWRHRGVQHKRAFRSLTEAKRFKRDAAAGDTLPTSRERFEVYALRWVDTYTGRTARGIDLGTRETYRESLERYAVPFFRGKRLDEIDAPELRRFIAHLSERHGLAPATIRRYYAPVRALLATAHEDGALKTNPAQGVRVIVPGERRSKPKRLTPDQTRRLLEALPDAFADLGYLIAATGVRISEALSVEWGDFAQDRDGRPTIAVARSKTEAGERTIALTAETARRLMRLRAAAGTPPADAPIFPNARGGKLDVRNFRRRVFKPAAVRAGVPQATPHMLRHGVASLMAERGYSPAEIAAQLGHADGGVLALRTYVHPDPHAAPEFLDDVLGERAS